MKKSLIHLLVILLFTSNSAYILASDSEDTVKTGDTCPLWVGKLIQQAKQGTTGGTAQPSGGTKGTGTKSGTGSKGKPSGGQQGGGGTITPTGGQKGTTGGTTQPSGGTKGTGAKSGAGSTTQPSGGGTITPTG